MTVAELLAKLQELSADNTVSFTEPQLAQGRLTMVVSLPIEDEHASAIAELFSLPLA